MKNEIGLAGNLIKIIENSRNSALRKVNEEFIKMYWGVGEYLSKESQDAAFGDSYIDSIVKEIQDAFPGIKGFNRRGLYRMKQFYETYVDEEYRVEVGGEDFRIDLLFYHRGLQCLVAIELKIGKFKPEYISKMDFYLEALDRQKKKENENPSVGMILCASKDDEVVEYAMSRSMSPMMVAEYKLQLPDKTVLQKKLQELISIPLIEE